MPDIVCGACGVKRERPATRHGGTRVPAGWKRLHEQFWCPTCKRQRFVLRAIALPVSGPADATWDELRAALGVAFGETTRCANWLATQFYTRDRQRQPGDARLATMPRVYLYPEARKLFPALASQTLASLEQQVLARYRATRLALVWRHAAALPTYRYPTPLPLPARMWTLDCRDDRWCLSARIGDRRWTLRLRQGPGMTRQIGILRQIAEGTLEAGEATLYEIVSHHNDHRTDSAPERRLMVKIAVWLERPEDAIAEARATGATAAEARTTGATAVDGAHAADAAAAATILIVRTSADAFLTARLMSPHWRGDTRGDRRGETWTLHADQVRGWMASAARRRRHTPRLHRRLHDWTHQATARLVAFAARHRVRTIVWNDADGGYLPSYPWRRFLTTLTDKAALAGIRVMVGHLQAEARARPGTLAGRDRSWERAQAPEIAGHAQAPPGRSDSESESDLNSAWDSPPAATPIVEGRSSGTEARRASSIRA
jgi:hypothetical protein